MNLPRRPGKAHFTYETGPHLSHLSLYHLLTGAKDIFTADKLQHGVSEKFQTLIVSRILPVLFIGIGAVRQSIFQKLHIPKCISNYLLKFFQSLSAHTMPPSLFPYHLRYLFIDTVFLKSDTLCDRRPDLTAL